jgi:hypothetical protein
LKLNLYKDYSLLGCDGMLVGTGILEEVLAKQGREVMWYREGRITTGVNQWEWPALQRAGFSVVKEGRKKED